MKENKYWTQEQIDAYIKELEDYNSKEDLKIDLHNHTLGSDGSDSPLMLLLKAKKMGLDTISITDHNSIKGYKMLEHQLDKIISNLEEIINNPNISIQKKQNAKKAAKNLFDTIKQVNIITGCEVLTIFKGCPYVEILAYDVDLDLLEHNLTKIRQEFITPGEKIYTGLKEAIKKYNIKIDEFFLNNRNDYRKLFFHELLKHPENAFLYEKIPGKNEEEKSEYFSKKYIENPNSDFFVDLNNSKTRKKEMLKMIKNHPDITFDYEIIKNAGFTTGEFYTELLKYPENKHLIDKRITSLKTFNYLGLYNENSPFFVDLSSITPTPNLVVDAIHDAGGKALIAHWGKYLLSNEDVFNWKTINGRKNLEELIDICDGAECAYPDNPIELRKIIYDICKEKGKIISIGGDNHGKNSKEDEKYQLGSQNIKDIDCLKWVKKSVIKGKDFISSLEEKHKYKNRLELLINDKEEYDK